VEPGSGGLPARSGRPSRVRIATPTAVRAAHPRLSLPFRHRSDNASALIEKQPPRPGGTRVLLRRHSGSLNTPAPDRQTVGAERVRHDGRPSAAQPADHAVRTLISYFSYFVGALPRPALLTGLSRAAEVCRSSRPVRKARTGARGHRTGGVWPQARSRRGPGRWALCRETCLAAVAVLSLDSGDTSAFVP
jgi:hypothetical protein